MIDFFDKLAGIFEMLWDFIINLVESLLLAVTILSKSLHFPLEVAAFMPAIISSSVLIIVALFVAKFIIGR